MNEQKIFEQLQIIKKMNRDQKRALCKKLHIKYQQLKEMLDFEIADIHIESLPEGAKVKMKYDQIKANTNPESVEYLNWVETHKDEILTVERDPSLPEDSTRCVFAEDESDPKWIFHMDDLELIIE